MLRLIKLITNGFDTFLLLVHNEKMFRYAITPVILDMKNHRVADTLTRRNLCKIDHVKL